MNNKTRLRLIILIVFVVLVGGILIFVKWWNRGPQPGSVLDEARAVNRSPGSLPAANEDYFHDMDQTKDGVVALTPEEVKGRNSWVVWTGGNDRLWDKLTV